MSSSSNTSGPFNYKEFITTVQSNTFLQDEGTDNSLQPGEEYPKTPHPYMVTAHKHKGATMNHIIQLLDTKPADVPLDTRADFTALRKTAQAKWSYPYTVENTCGTITYEHWKTQFDTAIIQIVSAQFQHDRKVTKEGKDLFSQGTTRFMDVDPTRANSISAKGLQICQPLLLDHMYYCRNSTLL
jgi:hypothetical protein